MRARLLAPSDRSRRRRPAVDPSPVVWQAASLALGYPDEALLARVPVLRRALEESAPERAADFAGLLDALDRTDLRALQTEYVEVFDLSRKRALHLSYWTDGDTRRRGEVLTAFKARYRACGFLVDLAGELPDHLPLVLEYAAVADPVDGAALLQEYRPSLELLRFALLERSRPYAGVLAAVCASLPGASPTDRRAVQAMARSGPPSESVGLAPYDARLLPVLDTGGSRPTLEGARR